MLFGIRVINGETGHTPLAYNAFFLVDDYEYTFPARAMTRHLGHLADVVGDLKTVFDEAAGIEVFECLRVTMSFNDAVNIIAAEITPAQFEKVQDKIQTASTALDLISQLSKIRNERGYKAAATNAINSVLEAAFAQIK